MHKPVLFSEERVGPRGLGVITLNNPKSLNALNQEMFQLMIERLRHWQNQKDIAAILLQSNFDKAFCAGGDVKSLIAQKKSANDLEHFQQFFKYEYFTDHLIHTYPKPVICWADGITMGGGIGIMNGASHRIVTERSTLAMPEITIGFFPDVGGSYFLNKLPEGLGLFLGLTSGRLNGADAVALGLADTLIESGQKARVLADLLRLNWSEQSNDNQESLNYYFNSKAQIPENKQLASDRLSQIQQLTQGESIEAIDHKLRSYETNDPWLKQCIDTYKAGSPTSAKVIFEQIKTGKGLDLRDVFLREWDMAITFCQNHDFAEGVRALLIDKDKTPRWQPSQLADVGDVSTYFQRPSDRPHLLMDYFDTH